MCPYPLQWKAGSSTDIYGVVQDSMAESQKDELKRGWKLLWVSLATFRRRSKSEHGEGLISTNNEPVGRDYMENLQMVGKRCFLNWRNIAYGNICRFKEEDIKDFESPKRIPFVGKARGITWYICFSSPEHPFFLLILWGRGASGLFPAMPNSSFCVVVLLGQSLNCVYYHFILDLSLWLILSSGYYLTMSVSPRITLFAMLATPFLLGSR